MRHFPLLLALSVTCAAPTLAKPKAKPAARPKTTTKPKPAAKPAAAQEKMAETAFKTGAALMEQEKYAQALTQFQVALKVFPSNPDVLWNAGTAAFSSNQFPLAANYFERDVKQEPLNGQLYARLVQTYQALGDLPRRDARRAKVFAMHRSGKDPSGYTLKDRYCRDQFSVKGLRVYAFESFALRPRAKENLFGVRYEFLVAVPGEETETMRLEVGWNYLDPDGKGGFKPASEMSAFYFDAYYPSGEFSRKTFGLFPSEMPYDAVKQRLIDILNNKVEMTSGRTRGTKDSPPESVIGE